jgi:hypothetical protein
MYKIQSADYTKLLKVGLSSDDETKLLYMRVV